jgi:hypothetical protein
VITDIYGFMVAGRPATKGTQATGPAAAGYCPAAPPPAAGRG